MTELDVLEEFGLSEAEAKVYLTLLETGSTLAGLIIKKTSLHRGTTYQILQRLIGKGLVSYVIKSGKRYFEAADPNILLDLLKDKEENLKEILPLLQAKKETGKLKQEVAVYSGVKGIKTIMDKMLEELKPNGKYYDFGVSGLFKDVVGSYWDFWQKKKKKYKIKSYVIFNSELKKKNPQLLKNYFGETKFHPKEYNSSTDTMIYKDTIILFIWTANPPIAVVIKNRENAESYKKQFELMWKLAKK